MIGTPTTHLGWSYLIGLVVVFAGTLVYAQTPVPTNAEVQVAPARAACEDSTKTERANYVVDAQSKVIVNMAARQALVRYQTDDELRVLLSALGDNLLSRCLEAKGLRLFDGFLLGSPAGDDWQIERGGEALTPSQSFGVPIAFLRTRSDGAPATMSATVVAAAAVKRLPSTNVTNGDEVLRALTADLRADWAKPRYKLIAFDTFAVKWDGAECIKYHISAEDHDVPGFRGKTFKMAVRGVRCGHPDRWIPQGLPILGIDVSYSARSANEPTGSFDSQAEQFLAGLVFRPLETRFYVIASLENYGARLKKMNKANDARLVERWVDALRKASEGGKGSADLGFDPRAALQQYSAFLTTQNQNMEAKEIAILAAEDYGRNFWHFLRLQQPK